MLKSLLREFFQFGLIILLLSVGLMGRQRRQSKWQTCFTQNSLSFQSKKDVPLAWSVMLGYFPLKLILSQEISQSPNMKIFFGAESRICQTYPHASILSSKHSWGFFFFFFFTRSLFFTQNKKATGGLSCELTRHCQPCLSCSREPGPGPSCHSPLSA